ncbi:hypothetical protein [Nocardia sp. NPDC004260]
MRSRQVVDFFYHSCDIRASPSSCLLRKRGLLTPATDRPVAQTPWILVDQMLIADAAGARATLVGLLAVVAAAAVTVLPVLAYLFWLTQTDAWVRDEPARTGAPEQA